VVSHANLACKVEGLPLTVAHPPKDRFRVLRASETCASFGWIDIVNPETVGYPAVLAAASEKRKG
jgi:hypothetical protein